LRPETPPESLFGRFAAKKFCLGESLTASALAAAKACAREASCSAREREKQTTTRDKNPQFIGISASQMPARLKICSMRILRNTAGCLRGAGGARHLHTKLSGVTVIFFLL